MRTYYSSGPLISIISKSRSGDPHDVILDRGKVEDEMIIEKESGWVRSVEG